MTIITDHVARAVGRLIEQFKNKTGIEALITSTVEEIQEIEDVIYDLKLERINLDLTEGNQLDRYGVIVGQAREGRTDDEYRIRIRARIVQNVSQGEPERVIQVVQLLLMPDFIHLQEPFPAGVIVGISEEIPVGQEDNYYFNIQLVLAAGIRLDAIVEFDPIAPFVCSNVDGDPLPIGKGFAKVGDTTNAGIFARVVPQTLPRFVLGYTLGDITDPNADGFGTLGDPLAGGKFVSAV